MKESGYFVMNLLYKQIKTYLCNYLIYRKNTASPITSSPLSSLVFFFVDLTMAVDICRENMTRDIILHKHIIICTNTLDVHIIDYKNQTFISILRKSYESQQYQSST